MAFSAALAHLNTAVLSTFGEALVTRDGYPAVTGVFDHRAVTDDVLGDISAAAAGLFTGPVPVLTLADADAVGISYGSELTVSGTAYTVRDIAADGAGLTRLALKKA